MCLSLGEDICKAIPFKGYFYFKFGFDPKDVDVYSIEWNKTSMEVQPRFSTSSRKEEEEETKGVASLKPFVYSNIVRLFGFSSSIVSKICAPSTTQDGEGWSCLEEYGNEAEAPRDKREGMHIDLLK